MLKGLALTPTALALLLPRLLSLPLAFRLLLRPLLLPHAVVVPSHLRTLRSPAFLCQLLPVRGRVDAKPLAGVVVEPLHALAQF